MPIYKHKDTGKRFHIPKTAGRFLHKINNDFEPEQNGIG